MKIFQIDKTNFMSGNVKLKMMNSQKIGSLNAIKKIAEDKDIDILISKNKETKYLPVEDMYMVIASKQLPIIDRGFFFAGYTSKFGMSCLIVNKKLSMEELSVKLYNVTMTAIEKLEHKLTNTTKR